MTFTFGQLYQLTTLSWSMVTCSSSIFFCSPAIAFSLFSDSTNFNSSIALFKVSSPKK